MKLVTSVTTMSIKLDAGDKVPLPKPLLANGAVTFTSSTLSLRKDGSDEGSNIYNVTLSLHNNVGDYILHIAFRPNSDIVVLNTAKAHGAWEKEIHVSDLFRAFGPDLNKAVISVANSNEAFIIRVNGNFLYSFQKRIGGEAVAVRYQVASGYPSIFDDPIQVTVQ